MQEGRLEAALAFIERARSAAPGATRYGFGLGQALSGLGRYPAAAAAYRKVIEAEPQLPEAHFGLGLVLQARGDLPAAVAAYQEALRLRPEFAEALNNLGNCRRQLGQLPEAEAAYRRALALRPNYANAMSNLGAVLPALGRADAAVALLEEAARLEPKAPSHLVNLGVALCERRRFNDAVAVLEKALAFDRRIPEAAYNLGLALHRLGRIREAADQYRRAVALKPGYAEAFNNLGDVCRELGEFDPALEAFAAATKADPASPVAFNNAGGLLRSLGRMEEAEAMLRRALAIDPNSAATLNNLGNVLKDCGDLASAVDCFRRVVSLDPDDVIAHSNLVYSLTFQAADGRTILEEARKWDARHGAPLRPLIRRHNNDRSAERRLRVGYVSGDFRDHCQTLFTLPLLSNHDREALEIFCYSGVERPDGHTARLERLADVWRKVRYLDDAELGEVIRRDQIDILVDLEMHMANGRPLLFARKPAPVQVAWLAYPATTGMGAIDAVFTDPRLAPPGSDSDYSERVVRLEDTFWCYDPLTAEPGVNALPALADGRLTLACLNAPCKISDHAIRMWGGVMRALENSRLLIMAPPSSHRGRLEARLAAEAIAPERVEIVPFQRRLDYLRTYHRIDFALDTFPYNGHTTSLDAYWMGVPVVSRAGQTAVGRAGLSQLFNLGLDELAADGDARFVETAVALGKDLPHLAALRRDLRSRMERSPLMDGRRFAKAVERAYRELWRDWCRGPANREGSPSPAGG
ncbi:MAG TPA: tetratricopeptide repeat protein [Caulobacteraceae bacterium]|nr:tetratricopeptide repeat protein [Caulobacteraceae bacterium]